MNTDTTQLDLARRRGRYAIRVAGLGILYALAAKIGLGIADLFHAVSLIWLPSGVAVAASLYYGYGIWPGLALGAALAAGMGGAVSAFDIAAMLRNIPEALAGAYLLKRFDVDVGLVSIRDILLFVAFGAGFSAAIGAITGAIGLSISGGTPPPSALGTWWIGDVTGILVVAPLLLSWKVHTGPMVLDSDRIGEGVMLMIALICVSLIAFATPSISHAARYPLAYLLSPLLFWAAFRFEHRGATTAVVVVVALALCGTVRDVGPLSGSSFEESLALLWAFMAVITVTTLLITALIGERRRAHAEREQLQRRLQQSQKMEAIGQLTSGIAHDFNNFLSSVIGFTELAQDKLSSAPAPGGDGTLAHYLAEVRHASHRARELVGQLLSFCRQSGGPDAGLDAASLLEEALRMLSPMMPATVKIRTRPLEEGLTVATNKIKFHQVVMNLCLNARDAMDGKGRIDIGVRRTTVSNSTCASCHNTFSGTFVELAVSDSGPGIDPDMLGRVFEPFFSTKAPGAGSGMGLAVVHGVVHGSGGHILVESPPRQGTRFRILMRPAALPDPASSSGGIPS